MLKVVYMQIYYLNSKGVKYVSQVSNVDVEKIKELNKDLSKGYVYVPDSPSGVSKLGNFNKDLIVKVDNDDDIEQLKKKYNIKHDLEIGDMFIVNALEKYVVRPLDTLEKIADRLGVTTNYIVNKNNLKTDKLFVGQILII